MPIRTLEKTLASEEWFAMRATFSRAMLAKRALEERSIENYLPMHYDVVVDRRGHKTKELVPVISNIIFVRTTKAIIQEAKKDILWLQYLTFPHEGRNRPIVVPNKQMEDFIAVTSRTQSKVLYLNPAEINLQKGTRVRIIGGPFDNVEGLFINSRGAGKKKLIVEIPGIIAAKSEIEEYDLIQVLD